MSGVEPSADSTPGDITEVKLIRFGATVQTWEPKQQHWMANVDRPPRTGPHGRATVDGGAFDGTPTYDRFEVRTAGDKESSRRAVSSAVFVVPPASSGVL
jgi:hypothetical protein